MEKNTFEEEDIYALVSVYYEDEGDTVNSGRYIYFLKGALNSENL